MSEDVTPFDVVIAGAGPAGATAALLLSAKGHRVALVDSAKFPRKSICAGWLSVEAKPLLGALNIKLESAIAQPFDTITFYNSDFSKSAAPKFETAPGMLINRTDFDERLVNAAHEAGAEMIEGTSVVDVELGESAVTLVTKNARPIVGRLFCLAAGRGTPLLERLRLGPGAIPSGCWAAHVEDDDPKAPKKPKITIVLGLDDSGGFGVAVTSHGRATVDVHTSAEKSSVVGTITTLCKNLVAQNVLGVDMSHKAARTGVMMTPAAVALAMDTHVAKRTLIIGDAGGFVSATSGEGIYPSMWSARIAADVIETALSSASPQDSLIEFNTRWRTEMAEYLRPPNTDTQYILPLIFSNQPMADRMGAAFFSGENI